MPKRILAKTPAWVWFLLVLVVMFGVFSGLLYQARQANLDYLRRQREKEERNRLTQPAVKVSSLSYTRCLGTNSRGKQCGIFGRFANGYCGYHDPGLKGSK